MDEWGRAAGERCLGRQRGGVVDIGRGHPCPRRDARRLVPPVPPCRHRPVSEFSSFGFRVVIMVQWLPYLAVCFWVLLEFPGFCMLFSVANRTRLRSGLWSRVHAERADLPIPIGS